MLMNIVIKDPLHFIYFFAGFVLMAFVGLDMVALVFIAALVAYLVYLASDRPVAAAVEVDPTSDPRVYEDDDLF